MNRKATNARKHEVKSLSIPTGLYAQALRKINGIPEMNLSRYIRGLIRRDLTKKGS